MTDIPSFAVGPRLEAALKDSSGPVIVVSPYIILPALERLLKIVGERPLHIVTDWNPKAVATGATDPRIMEAVRGRRDTTIRLLPGLHAKLFWTQRVALVGSANLTMRGTGWGGTSNYELMVTVEPSDRDVIQFTKLIDMRSRFANLADADAAIYAARHQSEYQSRSTGLAELDEVVQMLRHNPSDVIRAYAGEIPVTPTLEADLALLRMPVGMTANETVEHLRRTLRALPHYAVATKVADLTATQPSASAQIGIFVDVAAASGLSLDAAEDPALAWERLMLWMTRFLGDDFGQERPGRPYLVRRGVF